MTIYVLRHFGLMILQMRIANTTLCAIKIVQCTHKPVLHHVCYILCPCLPVICLECLAVFYNCAAWKGAGYKQRMEMKVSVQHWNSNVVLHPGLDRMLNCNIFTYSIKL